MKIEVLIDFKDDGKEFTQGDQVTVTDQKGEYYCRAGWSKDLSGLVKTGNPSLTEAVLEVQDISNHSTSSLAG